MLYALSDGDIRGAEKLDLPTSAHAVLVPRRPRTIVMASPASPARDNPFRRTRYHDLPTPSQNKRARREKLEIQQNVHQQNDSARGFVKGQPTGNCTALFKYDDESEFDRIEKAINSSRLSEELKCCSGPFVMRLRALQCLRLSVCSAAWQATRQTHGGNPREDSYPGGQYAGRHYRRRHLWVQHQTRCRSQQSCASRDGTATDDPHQTGKLGSWQH